MGKVPKSFIKYVLKLNYELTGDTDIKECSECHKSRLCQEYEKPNGELFYLCEQCTWEMPDEEFKEYYPDM